MEKRYDDDEIEIDLKELFFELMNNWVMIAVSTVLVLLIKKNQKSLLYLKQQDFWNISCLI